MEPPFDLCMVLRVNYYVIKIGVWMWRLQTLSHFAMSSRCAVRDLKERRLRYLTYVRYDTKAKIYSPDPVPNYFSGVRLESHNRETAVSTCRDFSFTT